MIPTSPSRRVTYGTLSSAAPNPHRLVEHHAAVTPDRTAARFEDDVWTYQDLNSRANRLAHMLRLDGIGPSSPVLVCSSPSLVVLATLLAIHKIGAVYVPLGIDYPKGRLQAIVEELQPAMALISDDVSAQFQGLRVMTRDIEKVPWTAAHDPGNFAFDARPEDTAYILYTSGTTGEPKGIEASHQAFSFYVTTAVERFGIDADDTVLSIARYSFVISLFELMCPLITGASLLMLKRDDVLNVARLTAALERTTVVNIGPSLLRKALTFIRARQGGFERFDRMRHVSVGGDMVQPDLLDDLKAVFRKAELFVLYGSTEVTCMGCTYPVPRSRTIEKTYVGRAFAGMDMALLGEDGKEAPTGAIGEVLFTGLGIMSGYVNKPALTREKFVTLNGKTYFRTGDLGRLGPFGDLELLGRRDSQIKLHGLRIEPVEVETCLRRAPGVSECLVATPDIEGQGRRLTAYIVPEDRNALSIPAIRLFLRSHLPDSMTPSAFVHLDALPLNRNFKVDRQALPTPTAADLLGGGEQVPPRDDIEVRLTELWSAELGFATIGITDAFADLGGDSLHAITLSILISEQFQVVLEPSEIFEGSPTIEDLAKVIREHRRRSAAMVMDADDAATGDGSPKASDEILPLAPPAARFLCGRKNEVSNRWNISQLLESTKPLDRDLLEQAVAKLIWRHDSLRLRFARSVEGWRSRFAQDPGPDVFSHQAFKSLADTQIADVIEQRAEALHASLDLDKGPVFRVEHIDLGHCRGHRLLIIAHHLVVDGTSWPILVRDLIWLYEQMVGHRDDPLPEQTRSYRDWLHALRGLAEHADTRAEADYWTSVPAGAIGSIPMDDLYRRDGNTNQSARSVKVVLSSCETRQIRAALPKGHSMTELFIPTLVNTLCRWTGNDWALIDLIENSRSLPDSPPKTSKTFTQSLGYMTTNIPFYFQAVDPADWQPSELSGMIRDARRRGFARELLSYLTEDPDLAARMAKAPHAEVAFNFGGRFPNSLPKNSLFLWACESHGNNHHATNPRYYPVSATVDRSDDRFVVKIVYSANLHERATMCRLLDWWLDDIRAFISKGGDKSGL